MFSRGFTKFPEYHSSLDNPNIIKTTNLLESLKICCSVIEILERNFIYKPNFKCEPFLSKYGIVYLKHQYQTEKFLNILFALCTCAVRALYVRCTACALTA